MNEIIILTVFSVLLFLLSTAAIVFGLIKRKKKLVLTALVTFVICIATSGYTIFLFATKSYRYTKETLRPRTGDEIYTALFGTPKSNCVKILHQQDQVVPKIDYAIWLHFKTCPEELDRILKLHTFEMQKKSAADCIMDQPNANDKWFNPANLGDSVLLFVYKKDEYGNGQNIFSNTDSTEVYCVDILD